MLVFIDDSGDPGFRIDKGSSAVFVISLVIFDDPLEAERTSLVIKELRRKLKVSDLYEFKFNKTNKLFKQSFFDAISPFNFRIRAIVVQKDVAVSTKLRSEKENFYNYIIMQVLKRHNGTIKNARLKFDKRGEKAIRNQLRVYLSHELDNRNKNIFTDLKFVDSRQNTLIQLADMVSGSIFSAYSKKDPAFFSLLKKRGRVEDICLFK